MIFFNVSCRKCRLIYVDICFKEDAKSYLNAFGKQKFQNELFELKRKLSPEWHAKLDEIEEVAFRTRNWVGKSMYILRYIYFITIIYCIHYEKKRDKYNHIVGFPYKCNIFGI